MIGSVLLLAVALATAAPVEDVQIIKIEVEQQPITQGIVYKCEQPTKHDWTDEELKQVAKVLWAETGRGVRSYQEKQCICYLILNRVRYGHPFAEDIVSVCKQKGEFNRGKVSDNNKRIAQESLDAYQSQLEGNLQNITFPTTAVYMGRIDGILTFYDINRIKVYEVK